MMRMRVEVIGFLFFAREMTRGPQDASIRYVEGDRYVKERDVSGPQSTCFNMGY